MINNVLNLKTESQSQKHMSLNHQLKYLEIRNKLKLKQIEHFNNNISE